MWEVSMTRDRLKECIEEGIKEQNNDDFSTSLTEEEMRKLREVGESIPYVAFGDWYVSNDVTCGCPVAEAKLGKIRDYITFAWGYDRSVMVDPKIIRNLNDDLSISKYGIVFVED